MGLVELDEPVRTGSQQTAKRAVQILLEKNEGFHAPTSKERGNLLVAFAMRRKVLYGAAFDIVRSTAPIDFSDVTDIARKMDTLTIYEIKSTNRPGVGPDLKDYFLTSAPLNCWLLKAWGFSSASLS